MMETQIIDDIEFSEEEEEPVRKVGELRVSSDEGIVFPLFDGENTIGRSKG